MIDIPLNKALAAVESGADVPCDWCFLDGKYCTQIVCRKEKRKDGKNVIFKLVDLPEEKNNAD